MNFPISSQPRDLTVTGPFFTKIGVLIRFLEFFHLFRIARNSNLC